MSKRRIPDWILEKHLLGEVDASELSGDPSVPERLIALQRSNEEILNRFPPRWLADQVQGKSKRYQNRKPSPRVRWQVALASAVVLIFVTPLVFLSKSDGPMDRAKGLTPSLHIYRKNQTSIARLTGRERVEKGDLLQLSYLAAGAKYGAIVSVDGRGKVTLHFPEMASESTVLKQDGEIMLLSSYELDDAPGFEKFILVTSDAPLDLPALIASLEGPGHKISSDLTATSITFNRQVSP